MRILLKRMYSMIEHWKRIKITGFLWCPYLIQVTSTCLLKQILQNEYTYTSTTLTVISWEELEQWMHLLFLFYPSCTLTSSCSFSSVYLKFSSSNTSKYIIYNVLIFLNILKVCFKKELSNKTLKNLKSWWKIWIMLFRMRWVKLAKQEILHTRKTKQKKRFKRTMSIMKKKYLILNHL